MPTRRRRQYGNPTLGSTNQDQFADTRSTNQAAANQYSLMHQQQMEEDDQTATVEQARHHLANLLGYKPGEQVPSFEGLKAEYRSKPPQIQAEIYKRGGAPFVGGAEGSKLLAGNQHDQESGINKMSRAIADKFINGGIVQDGDKYFEMVDDPDDPLGKKKKRQALNPLQLKVLDYAYKTGDIPNFDEPAAQAPQSPMTTDQFQSVLDRRSLGQSDTDKFQQVLNQRVLQDNPANLVASLNAPSPSGVSMERPSIGPTPKPVDSALALRNALGAVGPGVAGLGKGILDTFDDLRSAPNQFINDAHQALSDIPANIVNNIVTPAANWVQRFAHGEGAPQRTEPLMESSATKMQREHDYWMTPTSFNE